MINNIIDELKWRNVLKDVSNDEKVLLAQQAKKAIYCGFDPTNDSLHLGNLLQVILLRRFALFGFQPIALVGGGTAMIGDPSGKSQERNLLNKEQLDFNIKGISKQLAQLINNHSITHINVLDLINNFNLLSVKDSQLLEMIIKSINPNQQYQATLKTILAKLPLPLQELNLEHNKLIALYKNLNLETKHLEKKTNLNNLTFQETLTYLDNWNQTWEEFMILVWGKEDESVRNIKQIKILNNYDWLSKFSMLDFLRDVGKYFNLNQMLNKETVSARLETGISYTEFSYQALQAYDFYHLYTKENCYLQSGGSDQWGNITAGLDYIRKKTNENNHAAGITINLLTKANGEKFGKSEKGAVFLAEEKTSCYEMYQFLLNQEDKGLGNLIKSLTFLNEKQIDFIIKMHEENPKLRIGQKILAAMLTAFIHKLPGFFKAVKITNALFNDEIRNLQASEILNIFKDAPNIKQTSEDSLINVLVANNICRSRREVRELISDNALSVNGDKVTDENWIISKKTAINKQFSLVKKGKKNYFLIFHQY